MKKIYLLFFMASVISSCALAQKAKNNTTKVKGQAFYVRSFCGGARLTYKQEKAIRTPHPLSGKKLYIRKGDTNKLKNPVIDSIVTGDSGYFSLSLPPGSYCIIDKQKVDSAYYKSIIKEYATNHKYTSKANVKCLDQWLSKPEYTFTVIRGTANHIKITFYQKC